MVNRREEINLDRINGAIEPISHNSRFIEIKRREAEAEIRWLVASPGVLAGDVYTGNNEIATTSPTSFITNAKLTGSERNLNSRTLIYERSFILPKDTSEDGIDEFFANRLWEPERYRRIGSVSLNEPGFPILRPVRNDIHGYIETNSTGSELVAVGLDRYLNNPVGVHSTEESPEEIGELIHKTIKRIPNHQKKMIDAVYKAMKARG